RPPASDELSIGIRDDIKTFDQRHVKIIDKTYLSPVVFGDPALNRCNHMRVYVFPTKPEFHKNIYLFPKLRIVFSNGCTTKTTKCSSKIIRYRRCRLCEKVQPVPNSIRERSNLTTKKRRLVFISPSIPQHDPDRESSFGAASRSFLRSSQ